MHSGYEYVEEPSESQVAAAQAAIDAGAKLVIGHHAHILQGIDFYNSGVIVYGLGNFAFEIDGRQKRPCSTSGWMRMACGRWNSSRPSSRKAAHPAWPKAGKRLPF
ncbi:MAG: CapA family protein [Ardenticatenaceae bacterium]|nr:CapA family protein [Ardenticatenaceae bacterium]